MHRNTHYIGIHFHKNERNINCSNYQLSILTAVFLELMVKRKKKTWTVENVKRRGEKAD